MTQSSAEPENTATEINYFMGIFIGDGQDGPGQDMNELIEFWLHSFQLQTENTQIFDFIELKEIYGISIFLSFTGFKPTEKFSQ